MSKIVPPVLHSSVLGQLTNLSGHISLKLQRRFKREPLQVCYACCTHTKPASNALQQSLDCCLTNELNLVYEAQASYCEADSRGLVVGELQLSSGVLVVRPGSGSSWLGVVRQDDGPAGSWVAHHGHLHGAHALAHPDQALAEGEDAGVVVVQDGHRGDQRLNQTGFGGDANLVALKHPLCVADTQVEQAHKEVLVLFEYVVIDYADLEAQNQEVLFNDVIQVLHYPSLPLYAFSRLQCWWELLKSVAWHSSSFSRREQEELQPERLLLNLQLWPPVQIRFL